MSRRKKFGEILVESGVLDQAVLEQALEIQRGTRIRIGKILEEMRVISEREIAAVLARQFGFKTVRNLAERHYTQDLLALVPRELAAKFQAFPVRIKGRELYVAMSNPLDMEALDALSFQAGHRIVPCVTTPMEINQAIERHYGADDNGTLDAVSQRTRVLIVEPLKALRKELSTALSQVYEVAEVGDEQEALQIFRHLKPKALLTSTLLPRGNAEALLANLHKELAGDHLPAIALSANATLQEEVQCLEAGFSDYLAVPVHPQRLLARVARSLKMRPVS